MRRLRSWARPFEVFRHGSMYLCVCVLLVPSAYSADGESTATQSVLPGRLALERHSPRSVSGRLVDTLCDLGVARFVVVESTRTANWNVPGPYRSLTTSDNRVADGASRGTDTEALRSGGRVWMWERNYKRREAMALNGETMVLPPEFETTCCEAVTLGVTNVTCLETAQMILRTLDLRCAVSPWRDVAYFGPAAEVLRASQIAELLREEYMGRAEPMRTAQYSGVTFVGDASWKFECLFGTQVVARVVCSVPRSGEGITRMHRLGGICEGSAFWISLVLSDVDVRKVDNELRIDLRCGLSKAAGSRRNK